MKLKKFILVILIVGCIIALGMNLKVKTPDNNAYERELNLVKDSLHKTNSMIIKKENNNEGTVDMKTITNLNDINKIIEILKSANLTFENIENSKDISIKYQAILLDKNEKEFMVLNWNEKYLIFGKKYRTTIEENKYKELLNIIN